MATKKTTKKVATKRKTRKDADPEKGIPKLKGNLKLKYEASYYKYEAAKTNLMAHVSKLNELAKDPEFSPVFNLIKHRDDAIRELQDCKAHVTMVAKEVCEKFKIPFEEWKNYVVDEESGKVRHLPEEER